MIFFARKIPSGYELRIGGEMLPGDIVLSSDEYDMLLNERAQIIDGRVVEIAQVI